MADVTATAKNLIDKFKTRNPFEICDLMGISVVKIALPSNINGFFSNSGGEKIIFINNSLCDEKAIFCCAHELGHAIMHDNLNSVFLSSDTYFCSQKFENQADAFASHLLFEDADVLYERFGFTTADEISRYYNIDNRIFALRYENTKC